MTLMPCDRCATPAPTGLLACPHCGAQLQPAAAGQAEIRALPLLLLGLSLAGCGEKDDDTAGGEDTSVQALYGVAESADDEDAGEG